MDSRLVLPVNSVLDGGYRIMRVVGSGGFGITYEAEDLNLGTMVAIKEYYPIDFGDRDQVKRITVKPGAKLSVQMHHHRSEHWVVVRGTAKIQKGTETILLTENQSTYIPLGEIHSLENPGKIPLELIEVQCGPYLGEDDILRFDDQYGRADKGEGQGEG